MSKRSGEKKRTGVFQAERSLYEKSNQGSRKGRLILLRKERERNLVT